MGIDLVLNERGGRSRAAPGNLVGFKEHGVDAGEGESVGDQCSRDATTDDGYIATPVLFKPRVDGEKAISDQPEWRPASEIHA